MNSVSETGWSQDLPWRHTPNAKRTASISGVSGVTRGGNWSVSPYFFLGKIRRPFSVITSENDYLFSCRLLTTPIFPRRLSSVLSQCHKNNFRSGVTPGRCHPGPFGPPVTPLCDSRKLMVITLPEKCIWSPYDLDLWLLTLKTS